MTITYLDPLKVDEIALETYRTLVKLPGYDTLESIASSVASAQHMNHVVAQIVVEAHELGFDGHDFVTKMNQMLDYIRLKKGSGPLSDPEQKPLP